MRQWMVDPAIMCRQHLLGEHVEHHMFVGTINRGISVEGYLRDNLLEPLALHKRHQLLVEEMVKRGYNHKSPLPTVHHTGSFDDLTATIDRGASLTELLRRCPACRARYAEKYPGYGA